MSSTSAGRVSAASQLMTWRDVDIHRVPPLRLRQLGPRPCSCQGLWDRGITRPTSLAIYEETAPVQGDGGWGAGRCGSELAPASFQSWQAFKITQEAGTHPGLTLSTRWAWIPGSILGQGEATWAGCLGAGELWGALGTGWGGTTWATTPAGDAVGKGTPGCEQTEPGRPSKT